MSGVLVRCPKCRKAFRIGDRKLLGRKGKCSGCGEAFTLTEVAGGDVAEKRPAKAVAAEPPRTDSTAAAKPRPGSRRSATPTATPSPPVVETSTPLSRSASQPMAAPPAAEAEPLVGVNPRWIPDEPVAAPMFPFADAAVATAAAPQPPQQPAPMSSLAEAWAFTDEVSSSADVDVGEIDIGERKRLQRKRRQITLGAVGGGIVLAVVAAVLMTRSQTASTTPENTATLDQQNIPAETEGPYSRESLAGNLALVDEFRPTKGQPISMKYVPNGVNLVIHLRPAELWGKDRAAAELRASLTEGVVAWLESAIKTQCHREPSEITEATFVFVMGAFGTTPRSAVVVKLKEPAKPSALMEEFGGKLVDENAQTPITVDETAAHVLVDSQTYAIAPADTAIELADSVKQPNAYVSRNLIDLLKQTDEERLITIAAEVPDLQRHVDTLIPEPARGAVAAMLTFLGTDVDAFAWSLHAKPALHSQIVFRPREGVSPGMLRDALQKKLDRLPADMMAVVKATSPKQTGFRKVIGRFPAMLEAVKEATVLHVIPGEVQATTVLPVKAAPNLALGALLTWNEMRSGPSSSSGAPTLAGGGGASSVADLLKTPILAEFNRTPLEQAVSYIGDQSGVNFVVDGEALRMTGYTRNMPQTQSLGTVPAIEAIKAIVSVANQSDLALYIDEANKTAVLSTKPYLKQQGKTPTPLP
jgi:hypothetical protein